MTIAEIALKYVGEQEITGNMGFHDPVFERRMREIGFDDGDAWCCLFAELVWKEYYQDDPIVFNEIDALFSDSCIATLSNFRQSRFKVNHTPELGAIMIMQHYNKDGENYIATWQGHAGIVVDIQDKEIVTVEGNTNSKGGREGIEVALKTRLLNFNLRPGLIIKAFIHPL